jgi:NADH-quinone oxidoreductase subunit L
MVGPTPVSALIHSATMVAAGVYLLLRLFPLFAAAPLALSAVLWLGGLTALFAALVATVQYDIKRILAWSTVSQLGEMMLALGLAGPLAAAYHLATHATFKSALFLVAGAIDHAAGSRDLRRLGRLASKMVVTAAVFGVAALALAGVPPLSGFWSEDQILGQAVERGPGFVILMLTLIALAGVYISRLGVAAFGAWPDAPEPDAHAAGRVMQVPMIGLAVAAAGLGWLLSGQLGQLLPFGAGHHLSLAWRLAAVAAGLLGLAYGTWWVRTRGSAPAFGAAPGELERVLDVATQAPAQLAFALARALNRVEATLDGAVRHIAHGALRLAAVENAAEAGFDAAAQGLGRAGLAAAGVSNRTETRGFSDTLDAFARLFSRGGGRLRQLQTGKLYLYTLGLFVWVLVISLLGVLFWR